MENKYKKFSLKALSLALGIFAASELYAADKAAGNITKHGLCLDDITVPGFIVPESPKKKVAKPKKIAGTETVKKQELPKAAEQMKVEVSSPPVTAAVTAEDARKLMKDYDDSKTKSSLELDYYSVSNNVISPAYNLVAKSEQPSLGIKLSARKKIGDKCFANVLLGYAKEALNIYNNIRKSNAGKLGYERKDFEATIDKELENTTLSAGVKSFEYDSTDSYGGIDTKTEIPMTGMTAGINYSVPGTSGSVKVGYSGELLAGTSPDVKKISSSRYSCSVGPCELYFKTTAFDSTNMGVQQLYQQGIMPTEAGIKIGNKEKYFGMKILRDYGFTASASGLEGAINLSKNVNIKVNYDRIERNSGKKQNYLERTTIGVTKKF